MNLSIQPLNDSPFSGPSWELPAFPRRSVGAWNEASVCLDEGYSGSGAGVRPGVVRDFNGEWVNIEVLERVLRCCSGRAKSWEWFAGLSVWMLLQNDIGRLGLLGWLDLGVGFSEVGFSFLGGII